MIEARPTTHEKAFQINRDVRKYGSFAEIGAGQEVVRWFFQVGGAAGTVAKTISAYDMAISDAQYGPADRYVSRKRLLAMLDREQDSLLQQLDRKRGGETTFFVFADTMATRSYSRHQDGHGWMGIRFQPAPRSSMSQVLIHVRMLDAENAREQEAAGIAGVNLIHGALYHHQQPTRMLRSLLDGLDRRRLEVDLIDCSGPSFRHVDNRLLSLELVENQLTDAAMFAAEGETVLPSDVLYRKPALLHRGTFRPITNATVDMLERARETFADGMATDGDDPVVILEMTQRNLLTGGEVDHADFLARADLLAAMGHDVLVSNFGHYHSLVTFLRRHTSRQIVFALGVPNLRDLFREEYYNDLPGGSLEAMGRLFNGDVKLTVYPFQAEGSPVAATVENLTIPASLENLYRHLLTGGRIVGIDGVSRDRLHMFAGTVRELLRQGDPRWEAMVPAPAASIIKKRKLFGYGRQPAEKVLLAQV